MKTAVSIPDDIYEEADRFAAERGLNRSELYARALQRFLTDEAQDELTRRINETCGKTGDENEDLSHIAAEDLIGTTEWKW